jgi:ribonuclease HI/exonuclease III
MQLAPPSQYQQLRLLQYNVQKSKKKVLIGLLQDKKATKYDIIAVQEPWRNQIDYATYNPRDSSFHVVDSRQKGSRTCIYVNKRIPTSSWSETIHSGDICSVRLRLTCEDQKERVINVHSIYSPSPSSRNDLTETEPLKLLPQVLSSPGEHIALGDFNLHHPLWTGPSYPFQHRLADTLIEHMRNADLSLTLPKGTITRDIQVGQHAERTTIDLAFASPNLATQVKHCRIAREVEQSSDHLPIETEFEWYYTSTTVQPRRAWDKLDPALFLSAFHSAITESDVTSIPLRSRDEIDQYIADVTHAINKGVEVSTPWRRPSPRAKSFWTEECQEAVKATRKLRREYNRLRTPEAWEMFTQQRNLKGKTLAKAKLRHFREGVRLASESRDGIWRLARWARNRAKGEYPVITIPNLIKNDRTAVTPYEKALLLREHHFPPAPDVDLSDIENYEYPNPINIPQRISVRELHRAISKTKKDSAPGPDGIPNRIVKLIARDTPEILLRLFQACLDRGIHPTAFKKATTIIIRKFRKENYSDPAAYRPIALLNTLGKTLESIISERIRFAAESHALLPATQMGGRRMRSTDTAIQLITEKIHAIWGANRQRVASLLSLDVSGAFDRVSHARLLHNLRKRQIPAAIINWTADFLKERETEIRLSDFTLASSKVFAGIPQGSPISPILYLFYNADLLDVCDNIRLRTSASGFIDDINIITYSKSTAQNCRNLEQIHSACDTWATRHGSSFDLKKYDLIHFSRTPKRFRMDATVQLASHDIRPKDSVRVLGVILDPTLRWHAHLRAVEAKAAQQLNALKSLTGSIWGSSMEAIRKVYTATVRPAITFGCNAWYMPAGLPEHRKGLAKNLQAIQGRCLRVITGAYKATANEALEIETYIPPLDLYTEASVARTSLRLLSCKDPSNVELNALQRITRRSLNQRGRPRKAHETPASRKRRWLESRVGGVDSLEQRIPYYTPPWKTPPEVIISESKNRAIIQHKNDSRTAVKRIYADGSGINERIAAAAVAPNYRTTVVLGYTGDAHVYHAELAGISQALQIEAKSDSNLPVTIYSDSQAALKAIKKADPITSQDLFNQIYIAAESLANRGVPLKLQWVPGHKGIPGNEEADKAAKESATLIGPHEKPSIRYLSAIYSLVRSLLGKVWKTRWKTSIKGRHLFELTPEPTRAVRKLHAGVPKAISALITQLRTGKIGFNAFLHNRRVPGFTTSRCDCDLGAMTVRHVLLTCPKWKGNRQRYLARLKTSDIRQILNTPDGSKAAAQFILATDLLPQFHRITCEE